MKNGKYFLDPQLIEVIPILAIVFGSFLGIVITVFAYITYSEKKERQYQLALAQLKGQASERETKERETIIKEIVMVPCQYCGSLNPETSLSCSHCGAGRKLEMRQ